MTDQITRALCGAAGGALCTALAWVWTQRLLAQRGHELSLTMTQKYFLGAGIILCGVAIGILTEGVVTGIYGLLLLCICVTAAVIDWNFRIIPNETVLALLLLTLVFGIPALLGIGGFPPFAPLQSLLGLLACFAVFLAPSVMGKKVGAGDVKFAAAMGFCLGLTNALVAVVAMGVLMLAWCVVQNRMPLLAMLKSNIPMGPFITAGLFATFLWAA